MPGFKSVDKDLRHPDYIENKIRPLCDDCLDVAFSEWSYLARATHLIAQLGMHCLDKNGTCFSPRHRILGRASSFSHVAATYAHVPTTTNYVDEGFDRDPDPADFYPPGFRTLTRERPFPHAQARFCEARVHDVRWASIHAATFVEGEGVPADSTREKKRAGRTSPDPRGARWPARACPESAGKVEGVVDNLAGSHKQGRCLRTGRYVVQAQPPPRCVPMSR